MDENVVGKYVTGHIFFNPAVDSISYFVASHLGTRHTAYTNGGIVDQEIIAANNSDLTYSNWEEVKLSGGSITALVIDYSEGSGGAFAIDNLRIVRQFRCPGRPWFRDSEFRNQLADAWRASNPISPSATSINRRITSATTEKGGWIVREGSSEGDLYRLHTESVVASKWCSITNPRPVHIPTCNTTSDPQESCIIGKIHTHPVASGLYVNDVSCRHLRKGMNVNVASQVLSPDADMPQAIDAANYDVSYFVLYEGGGVLEYDPSQPDSTRNRPGCLGEALY